MARRSELLTLLAIGPVIGLATLLLACGSGEPSAEPAGQGSPAMVVVPGWGLPEARLLVDEREVGTMAEELRLELPAGPHLLRVVRGEGEREMELTRQHIEPGAGFQLRVPLDHLELVLRTRAVRGVHLLSARSRALLELAIRRCYRASDPPRGETVGVHFEGAIGTATPEQNIEVRVSHLSGLHQRPERKSELEACVARPAIGPPPLTDRNDREFVDSLAFRTQIRQRWRRGGPEGPLNE